VAEESLAELELSALLYPDDVESYAEDVDVDELELSYPNDVDVESYAEDVDVDELELSYPNDVDVESDAEVVYELERLSLLLLYPIDVVVASEEEAVDVYDQDAVLPGVK